MTGKFIHPRKFLLDTNIATAILNHDHSVIRQITPEMEIYLPSVVLGELYLGAHRSQRIHQNLKDIKSFAHRVTVLPCNAGTAEAYGALHAHLLNKGRPIPVNDVWIAAIAHQRGLTLITRDAHFHYIEFLSIVVW